MAGPGRRRCSDRQWLRGGARVTFSPTGHGRCADHDNHYNHDNHHDIDAGHDGDVSPGGHAARWQCPAGQPPALVPPAVQEPTPAGPWLLPLPAERRLGQTGLRLG